MVFAEPFAVAAVRTPVPVFIAVTVSPRDVRYTPPIVTKFCALKLRAVEASADIARFEPNIRDFSLGSECDHTKHSGTTKRNLRA